MKPSVENSTVWVLGSEPESAGGVVSEVNLLFFSMAPDPFRKSLESWQDGSVWKACSGKLKNLSKERTGSSHLSPDFCTCA